MWGPQWEWSERRKEKDMLKMTLKRRSDHSKVQIRFLIFTLQFPEPSPVFREAEDDKNKRETMLPVLETQDCKTDYMSVYTQHFGSLIWKGWITSVTDWDVASVVTLIHKRQSFYPPPFGCFEENFDEQAMNVTKKQRTNNWKVVSLRVHLDDSPFWL